MGRGVRSVPLSDKDFIHPKLLYCEHCHAQPVGRGSTKHHESTTFDRILDKGASRVFTRRFLHLGTPYHREFYDNIAIYISKFFMVGSPEVFSTMVLSLLIALSKEREFLDFLLFSIIIIILSG